jgi:hypothetical protein
VFFLPGCCSLPGCFLLPVTQVHIRIIVFQNALLIAAD